MMSQMQPMVAVHYVDDVVVVTIDREKILEEKDIQTLEETILPIIEENEPPKMVIDFCKVDYLSSSVLGLLIRLNTMIKDRGGNICLSNISERIFGIFKITRLDKVFSVFDESNEAVSHLRNK